MPRHRLVTLVVSLLLVACSGTQPPDGPAAGDPRDLIGTRWELVSLGDSAVARDNAPAFLLLEYSDSQFGGSSGCNSFGGTYRLNGANLQFLETRQTLMACQEPVMSRERAVMMMIEAVRRYRIEGRTLELLTGDKVVARFEERDRE